MLSTQGRKMFNYNVQNRSPQGGSVSKEGEDNIYQKKGCQDKRDTNRQNLYNLISSENSSKLHRKRREMPKDSSKISEKTDRRKKLHEQQDSSFKGNYEFIRGIRTNEQNKKDVLKEKRVKSCQTKEIMKTPGKAKPSKFIVAPIEKKEEVVSKRKTFQNRRNLKIYGSSKNGSVAERKENREEEELPEVRDFHTDETAKILKGMYFKKIESSGSERSVGHKSRGSGGAIFGKKTENLGDSPDKKVARPKEKSEEDEFDEDLFGQKKTSQSIENPLQSSHDLFFDKKLISDRDMVQNSIQSITKQFMKNSKEKNGDDSIFPFSKKQIESSKKILSEESQKNIRESLNQQDHDFDAMFGRKAKDNLSLSIEPSDRLINKNSFRALGMKVQNGSELEHSNFNSVAFQSNANIPHPFGLTQDMQLTKEKKMNGGNGEKNHVNFEMSSKFSCNSNFDMRMNEREINLDWIDRKVLGESHLANSREASSRQMWNESFRESNRHFSNRQMTREFTKASNEFLFEDDNQEPPNPRELPRVHPLASFKDMCPNDEAQDAGSEQNDIRFSKANHGERGESGESIKKKKSITTVKNYHNIPSSKVYSSPNPKKTYESNRISTFREMPKGKDGGAEEEQPLEGSKKKESSPDRQLEKKVEEQKNLIAELQTKNSNLNKLLEQHKQQIGEKQRSLKQKTKEATRTNKLFSKMSTILVDFRSRLEETVGDQQRTLKTSPDSFSFVENQNKKFVENAFNYEKLLMQKMKELGKLKEREAQLRKSLEERKNENINLEDKIQVHKNKTDLQENEIGKLNDKIKDYERIVENLEHELNSKEMKLTRKTRKYRKEIARAKKCAKCSQRSMRKIQGKKSEILLNDLNQIKEESLSNYSETDSDDQDVNLNDYQEVLDSRNKIQGQYNELMAKYLDCRNKKSKYQLRYQMLSDKNAKYRKILKEISKKPGN